jgi:hypothetical protein
MSIDYLQMLRQLVAERDSWQQRREEADRQTLRLYALIRATAKMLPPEQRTEGELLLDQIDQRPPGLMTGIRLCLSDPKHGWLTPVEIRNYLFEIRFGLENYTSNPLVSIHTTLKRMVPNEVEVKELPDGGKAYRLKRGAPLRDARVQVVAMRDMLALLANMESMFRSQSKDIRKR